MSLTSSGWRGIIYADSKEWLDNIMVEQDSLEAVRDVMMSRVGDLKEGQMFFLPKSLQKNEYILIEREGRSPGGHIFMQLLNKDGIVEPFSLFQDVLVVVIGNG